MRSAFREGRHADAWDLYRGLVAAGEAGADCHMWAARVAYALGDLFSARHAADRAVFAEPSGQLRAEVLLTRGVILQEIGEAIGAVGDLVACTEILGDYPALAAVMAGPAWNNLGLAYRQAGEFAAAVGAYTKALDIFRAEGLNGYLCVALHNRAWALCYLGDHNGARVDLQEAAPLCSDETLQLHQQLGQAFALSLGDDGEQRQALQLCERLASEGSDTPADVRSHALWVSGRVAMAWGLFDLAENLARQATDWGARAKGSNRCLNDAAALLRAVQQVRLQEKTAGA